MEDYNSVNAWLMYLHLNRFFPKSIIDWNPLETVKGYRKAVTTQARKTFTDPVTFNPERLYDMVILIQA